MPGGPPTTPHSVQDCVEAYRQTEEAANATLDAGLTACGTSLACKRQRIAEFRQTMNQALVDLEECVETATS